ncbi:MAG: hypothetical protein PUF12_05985 [Thermoflexaceae bacterium]|nr:hypothetical protein [Thermoflexaceae bacterium]
MKRERNELVEFLCGAAMLSAGLYLFCNKVTVTTGFFAGRIQFGDISVASGLTIIPLIIGIVMIFLNPDAFLGKLVTALGFIIIIVSIIASTHFYLPKITLFEWILYLVLIFGGLALVVRVLFAKPKE